MPNELEFPNPDGELPDIVQGFREYEAYQGVTVSALNELLENAEHYARYLRCRGELQGPEWERICDLIYFASGRFYTYAEEQKAVPAEEDTPTDLADGRKEDANAVAENA
jgi:hypothetical protein